MKKKLVAALACRNNGSRLYGKPLQNLDVSKSYTILDNIIASLKSVDVIDDIVLGISEGSENLIFEDYANKHQIKFIKGDQTDVLMRLIQCGYETNATDIFRVTSESPFVNYSQINAAWETYCSHEYDGIFLDDIIDGCGFEIIKMSALEISHKKGSMRHRSEMCTLYIRENISEFKIFKLELDDLMKRKDLRLTVDNPEDLVVCRAIFSKFGHLAPNIPLDLIVRYLDDNPDLIQLLSPFVESGYETMYL